MPTSASTLTCPQCGYVNEAERVYCHNCGAKLDRSLLPKEDDQETRDTIERTRKRVKKMTNPGRGMQDVRTFLATLGWAALAAAIILMARPPNNIPPKQEGLADRMIASELMDVLESRQPRAIQFNERDVNQHFAAARSKTKATIPGLKFERAFAQLEPGIIRVGLEQSVGGYPIYSGVAYKLQIKGGRLVATTVGGNFGRLQVHPMLMEYASAAFSKLWAAMTREKEQLDKMASVHIDKGVITFVTKGAVQ
jgi:hypothetical protein